MSRPQFDDYNFSSPAINTSAYVVNNTIGGLHRVAVVLSLTATPGDLQEMIFALASNATQLIAMSNASGFSPPISTIMHSGGFVKATPYRICGGLDQKLRSSGDSLISCLQGKYKPRRSCADIVLPTSQSGMHSAACLDPMSVYSARRTSSSHA